MFRLVSCSFAELDCTRPRCYDSALMSRDAFVALAQRLIRCGLAAVAVLGIAGCGSLVLATSDVASCATPGPASRTDSFNVIVSLTTAPSGLQYGDIAVGCGARPRAGQTVTLEYTGWLTDGRQFDSSRLTGRRPLMFVVGQGLIIPGIEQGVASMRVGGSRRLVIPPALAFGATARGRVPANSTILLTVELVGLSG
jgi:hypothetical protein